MGEVIPTFQKVFTRNNSEHVSWTKISGATSGTFFYMAIATPTFAAALGSGTQPTVTVDGNGTKITLTGTVDEDTEYNILAFHQDGVPRRFS